MPRRWKKRFVHRESAKHKQAKELLHGWLSNGLIQDVNTQIENDGDGVFMEYPLCTNKDAYKGLSQPPTYADCRRDKHKPIKVADIAVIRGGEIRYLFEIVHTHRIDFDTQAKLMNYYPNVDVYEIEADKIIRLTEPPLCILDRCELV